MAASVGKSRTVERRRSERRRSFLWSGDDGGGFHARLRERPKKIERTAMSNGTVTSADGTRIGYERHGDGDPVIVVNTVAEDRSGLSGLAGLLAEHFNVYTYDRRGRGDSGDTTPYAPEREVDDLAALWMAPEVIVASARQFFLTRIDR
jgi:hypothetical protein